MLNALQWMEAVRCCMVLTLLEIHLPSMEWTLTESWVRRIRMGFFPFLWKESKWWEVKWDRLNKSHNVPVTQRHTYLHSPVERPLETANSINILYQEKTGGAEKSLWGGWDKQDQWRLYCGKFWWRLTLVVWKLCTMTAKALKLDHLSSVYACIYKRIGESEEWVTPTKAISCMCMGSGDDVQSALSLHFPCLTWCDAFPACRAPLSSSSEASGCKLWPYSYS